MNNSDQQPKIGHIYIIQMNCQKKKKEFIDELQDNFNTHRILLQEPRWNTNYP